jgi:predicted nuclease of predicted toxin-antitoxin system
VRTVLLDNCVDHRLCDALQSHHVRHVRELGWEALSNGELVREAASQFDVLVTVDKNMRFQTSLAGLPLAVVVVEVQRNRLVELLEKLDDIKAAISAAESGRYLVI